MSRERAVERGVADRTPTRLIALTALVLAALGVSALALRSAATAHPSGNCDRRFSLAADGSEQVLYCARTEIGRAKTVRRLVIVVHGDRRDADTYFVSAIRAASRVRSRAYVLAPRFTTRHDLRKLDQRHEDALLDWSDESWKQGDTSRHSGLGRQPFSSFDVIDKLTLAVADRHPELKTVVIAGHSAGGQFVNRYAAGSAVPDLLAARGVDERFVVANPSSYLYLTPERPERNRPFRFAVPSSRTRADCPHYDEYKYGLNDLNRYMSSHGGASAIRTRYLSRTVTYLLGGADDDPHAANLDRTCGAELEGRTRLERGRSFVRSLLNLAPKASERQSLEVVPGVSHDAATIFASDAGVQALFQN